MQAFKILQIPNVFSLQTSIFKATDKKQLEIADYKKIGKAFCRAICQKFIDSPMMLTVKENKIDFLESYKRTKTSEFEEIFPETLTQKLELQKEKKAFWKKVQHI